MIKNFVNGVGCPGIGMDSGIGRNPFELGMAKVGWFREAKAQGADPYKKK